MSLKINHKDSYYFRREFDRNNLLLRDDVKELLQAFEAAEQEINELKEKLYHYEN